MTVQRGDVVLVRFPFSSGVGAKIRPALVVQSDRNNQRLTNTAAQTHFVRDRKTIAQVMPAHTMCDHGQ